MYLYLQPIVGADTADVDAQAGCVAVAVLDRVDASFAEGCFEILDALAVAAKPAGERCHGFAGDLLIA